ncbi:MAG: alpha/beta hydrolase, partial [Bacteroidota bacterium]
GIDARGKTNNICRSYRTTHEILNFATLFYRNRVSKNETDDDVLEPDLMNMPRGVLPILVPVRAAQDEISVITAEIVALAKSGYPLRNILVMHAEYGVDALIESLDRHLGAGKSADKILQEQLKTKLPLPLLIASNKILDSLRAGKTVADVDPSLVSLYRPSVQPYMISWIKYNPAAEISKLKIPVLIVQGTTDLQVSVEDAKLLSAAKPDAKLLIIENMNHVLKESDADTKTNMATYRNPELPLKPGFADELISFVTSLK